MATFIVNGSTVTVEKNQKLIRFLRDELHLTSVKDGCSEGACGTCHVLIDGKPTKACIPQTDKLEGKTIITVEGLSDWEKEVFTFAFGEAGAVQCGFCIPGMVISAKGLLDVNPDPTREEAAFAIRNNICRCTGYVKIIDGILLAAKIFREGKIPAPGADDWKLGSRVHRLDVEEKVLGYGQYPDDVYVDGMCYGGAVRSQYARARVLSIDTSAAEALPGVLCVATQKDIPGKVNVGHLKKDQPTLIGVGELVHYLGDSVALICAVDQETVEKAKKLVKVEYEVLHAVHNPTEAAAPDAPLVFDEEESNVQAYKHVSRGDAETAIKNSKYVLTEHFSTPWTEHAFLEPECCVALPLDNGGVKLLTTDQSAHTTMHECAGMLGVDYDHCQVQNCLVGGGFGGITYECASIFMAWELYEQYGDIRTLEKFYPGMQKYMDYMKDKGLPGTKVNPAIGPLGDWLAPEETDLLLLWNAFYYKEADLMSRIAGALGRTEEQHQYKALAAKVKKFWNETFVLPDSGKTCNADGTLCDTQCSYAIALSYDVAEDRKRIGEHLIRKTRAIGHTVGTGFFGTGILNQMLTEQGAVEDAWKMMLQTAFPSWLYPVTQGATTIWEHWDSYTKEKGFGGQNAMNSFNHYSLGSVLSWLYHTGLGIQRDETKPGYQHILLKPQPGTLEFMKGSVDSPYGVISAGWERKGDKIEYQVTIPVNTTATLFKNTQDPADTVELGSGTYTFML